MSTWFLQYQTDPVSAPVCILHTDVAWAFWCQAMKMSKVAFAKTWSSYFGPESTSLNPWPQARDDVGGWGRASEGRPQCQTWPTLTWESKISDSGSASCFVKHQITWADRVQPCGVGKSEVRGSHIKEGGVPQFSGDCCSLPPWRCSHRNSCVLSASWNPCQITQSSPCLTTDTLPLAVYPVTLHDPYHLPPVWPRQIHMAMHKHLETTQMASTHSCINSKWVTLSPTYKFMLNDALWSHWCLLSHPASPLIFMVLNGIKDGYECLLA